MNLEYLQIVFPCLHQCTFVESRLEKILRNRWKLEYRGLFISWLILHWMGIDLLTM